MNVFMYSPQQDVQALQRSHMPEVQIRQCHVFCHGVPPSTEPAAE